MRFYNATRFLFPRRYELRLLIVCFIAVHAPLLAFIGQQAITRNWQPDVLITILAATLAGTAFGLIAIHQLLVPVSTATRLIEAIQNGKRVPHVPVGGHDLIGRLLHTVVRAADESASRFDRLMALAERDPLTGVRNRRGFLESAESILDNGSKGVIALADIDHFKLINDQFGHDEGDNVLKRFSAQIEDGIRRSDIAARWGGEEFIMLFPDTTLDEALLVLNRLRTRIALDPAMGRPEWPVTFSCGFAPVHGFTDLAEATRRADAALYSAKQEGRNRICAATD